MHNFQLLEILAIGLSLALVLGFVTHRLKLSPIVGYLLAGFLIGPYSPGFEANGELAGQLAEVGVILLMFGVGLHFDLSDLAAVRRIAVTGAVAQSAAATLLGLGVALAFGLPAGAGLVLGMGVAVASTVVLMRVLTDNHMLESPHGHVAVGWLIVEDILTVFALVLLPAFVAALSRGETGGAGILGSLALALAKIALLCLLVLPVGGRVIPWLLAHVARSRSSELFTLAVLAMAFVIATAAATVFGASVALGAFLGGMVVGRTKVSHQAAADVLPMRDAFAVIFFLSVGMLFDPRILATRPGFILCLLGVILAAKPLVAGLVVVVLGYSVRTALTVAFGLAQIGEFSFILAQQGQELGLVSHEDYSILVACALVTISLNPLVFRALGPVEDWLRGRPRLWNLLSYRADRRGREANLRARKQLARGEGATRAVVVGYGPVGRRVAALLRVFSIEPVVVDLNVDTVNALAAEGHAAVYGDATRRSILLSAGIQRARYLLITLPDLSNVVATVTTARRLNPDIEVLVRARYLGAQPILAGLGVTAISVEEEEVAKAMAETLLAQVSGRAPAVRSAAS